MWTGGCVQSPWAGPWHLRVVECDEARPGSSPRSDRVALKVVGKGCKRTQISGGFECSEDPAS